MSSLATTARPARRLLSLAGRGVINTGRRGYAKPLRLQPARRGSSPPKPPPPSPSYRIQRRPPPGSATNQGPPRLLFSEEHVPQAPQWEEALRNLENEHLTVKECIDGAHRYVAVATQYDTQWIETLESEHSLSPYLLHWMAILLTAINADQNRRNLYWSLAVHMLRAASELGYAPSTLTLFRMMMHWRKDPKYEKALASSKFRSVQARFDILVKGGRDPDALTLQGLRLMEEGDHDRALDCFRRATKAWKSDPGKSAPPSAARPRPQVEFAEDGEVVLPTPQQPRWDWEASCVLGEADILKARGKPKEARELYRVAALELDSARGFLELANLMDGPRDGPERRKYLLKAAVSGQSAAFRELGVVEEMRAQHEGITERESTHRSLVSKEWYDLADEASPEKNDSTYGEMTT